MRVFSFRRPPVLRESFDFSGLTENPLSLSSRVTNGLATGLDWNNIQSVSGKGATGTAAQSPPPYNDNICTINPPTGYSSWNNDQDLIGKVFVQNQGTFGGFHEVELLLRFSITANVARGYEVIFSVGPTNYLEIVAWKGPLGTNAGVLSNPNAFVSLANSNLATAPTISNGHYVRANVTGTVITGYHKTTLGGSWTAYVQHDTVNDLADFGVRWDSGKIGIGNWDNGAGSFDDYAIQTLDVTA